jgi:integrase
MGRIRFAHHSRGVTPVASFDYDPKTGKARIFFRVNGRQCNRRVPVGSAREAERIAAAAEQVAVDLKLGRITIPDGADVAAFVISGGKSWSGSNPFPIRFRPGARRPPRHSPRSLDVYATALTPGAKEANSLETEAVHARHLRRVLGEGAPLDSLGVAAIQRYVDRRAKEGVVRATIRKELATLRVVWGWAHRRGLVPESGWAMKDLTFPKGIEKPPFQTWEQITRRIERGGLADRQRARLWECLWLNESETVECLVWVREHARHPFVYPLVAVAAYTGARRGEILRSERDDWDFDGGTVAIREKKADRTKTHTIRTIPIHPDLRGVMTAWFRKCPGSHWAISTPDGRPISPQKSTECLRSALAGGKWAVVPGFHCFRHSIASIMAAAGIDQRLINGVLGHRTGAMERRYRHLLPQAQQAALGGLFRTP